MTNDSKEVPSGSDLLKNSSLYREFQAEREEILRHKWIESEKAGGDIGFERARADRLDCKASFQVAKKPAGGAY